MSGMVKMSAPYGTESFKEGADELPLIVVRKALRILELWRGGTLRAQYRAGLGFSPAGDKTREGDGATPEGVYHICMRNPVSRFYKSFGLDYPGMKDAVAALSAGRIDCETCDGIARCFREGKRPPAHTVLGGEICIHGHGGGSDWTAGCVAVDDEAMDALWEACPIGTPVVILP